MPDIIEKLPPQSLEAERSVLGALLLDKEVFFKIADILQPEDFYKDAHRYVYESVIDLSNKNEAFDILTVSARLEEKTQLEKIGGRTYLAELTNSVPSTANAVNYARIVHRKATLRRLLRAANNIMELGYHEEDDLEEILDNAQREVFGVSQTYLSQTFLPIRSVLADAFERIDELHRQKGKLRGIPTGFPSLDNILAGLQKSDLVVLAARPSVGKTSLALDIARHVAVKEKIPVGIFSLEMSKDQLVDRLLCAEARVDLWRMRTGRLSDRPEDDDFPRIGHAMGVLSEAPIFIDDSPNVNIMQIRAKARRLQAEHGLGLIMVDYLQLMESRDTSQENRVQEVAEITRGLKGIARELSVPVLALSQLARAVEMAKPAIPKLSHLRESGCLTGDTLIMNARTGELITMKALADRKVQTPIPVHSLDENWKLVVRPMIKVFSNGKKEIFELRMRSGRVIRASANHPFRKLDGWHHLDQLTPGDALALPRQTMAATSPDTLSEDELILLAHLLGDGCVVPNPNTDVVPALVWKTTVARAKAAVGMSWRDVSRGIETAYCGSTLFKSGVSRERLARLASTCKSQELTRLATSDVFWDKIESINPCGAEEVYDATVEDTHNFVANDIIVHNSIEQDADVVLFIYRKAADRNYRMEDIPPDERRVAEIHIAKHRNGPTGLVRMIFDEERASFRSLDTQFANVAPPPALPQRVVVPQF